MTIEETIARERQQAKEQRSHIGTWDEEYSKKCEVYAEEHEQLAEWLEELKSYRASVFSGDMTQTMLKEEYNNAIDDLAEKIIRYVDCGHLCSPTEIRWSDLAVVEMVKKLAEQLKAGDTDEMEK